MGSWIILIDHGVASQPIIEHYSQFVRLARVNPKIDRQGQRIIREFGKHNGNVSKDVLNNNSNFTRRQRLP